MVIVTNNALGRNSMAVAAGLDLVDGSILDDGFMDWGGRVVNRHYVLLSSTVLCLLVTTVMTDDVLRRHSLSVRLTVAGDLMDGT